MVLLEKQNIFKMENQVLQHCNGKKVRKKFQFSMFSTLMQNNKMLKMHFCEQYWFFEWKTINYFAGIFNFLSWKKNCRTFGLGSQGTKKQLFCIVSWLIEHLPQGCSTNNFLLGLSKHRNRPWGSSCSQVLKFFSSNRARTITK